MVRRKTRRAARTRRTGLGLDHDRDGGIDDSGPEERIEPDDGGGRHAARRGDPVGRADFLTVEFRHAVDEPAQRFEIVVLVAVPGWVTRRIVQAEVRTEVDDDRGNVPHLGQLLHRDTVRKGEKEDIAGLEVRRGDELEISALAEVRMDRADELARISFGRHLLEADLRMTQQESDKLTPCISTATDDRDVQHGLFLSRSDQHGVGPYECICKGRSDTRSPLQRACGGPNRRRWPLRGGARGRRCRP